MSHNSKVRKRWAKEGTPVKKRNKKFTARLKGGAETDDAAATLVQLAWLKSVKKKEPEHFEALVTIARGEEIQPEMMKILRKRGCVTQDGTMRPRLRETILAALDKQELEDPWELQDEEDKTILRAAAKELERRMNDLTDDEKKRGGPCV